MVIKRLPTVNNGCYFLHPPYLLFSPPSSHILTGGACVGPTVFLSQGGCNQERGRVCIEWALTIGAFNERLFQKESHLSKQEKKEVGCK
ncbi:hypothetical protein HanIR_Chr16g0834141 [Helianthus annuus]|nr:hypothetical protein HanIR_Chr16g0834141 [Helianthus annuus]